MDAYYYGFSKTGNKDVDLILSAVACAGKAYHHTSQWTNEMPFPYPGHTGISCDEMIQNAANKCAEKTDSFISMDKEIVESVAYLLDTYRNGIVYDEKVKAYICVWTDRQIESAKKEADEIVQVLRWREE